MPAFPNWPESAMLKQPACAAATSSSGFVPTPFSKRVEKEYCVSFRTPLAVETVPLPSFKPPAHRALDVRTMSLISSCLRGDSGCFMFQSPHIFNVRTRIDSRRPLPSRFAAEFQNARAEAAQKRAVMRDENHRALEILKR